MARLTRRYIETVSTDDDHIIFDDELTGFGLRVRRSGRRTFIVQYRAGGRSRRMTIGAYGPVTPEEARRRARIILGEVAAGHDPMNGVHDARRSPTVASLCDRFLAEHVDVHLKPSTARNYRATIRDVIVPHSQLYFGRLKMPGHVRDPWSYRRRTSGAGGAGSCFNPTFQCDA